MKKILFVTYYWPPSGGAGVQRALKFVKYLPEFGVQPYVLTVDEKKASYPFTDNTLANEIPSSVNVRRTDTSEPFGIYSRLTGKKSIPTGFSNESNPGLIQKSSRFIRGNFFIPDARRGWIKFALNEAQKIIDTENIETVITTSPPHSAQLIGLELKKIYNDRLNWIADLRDPWTDIYYYNEFHHLNFAKLKDLRYESEVLNKADFVVTVSNELKELFKSKTSGKKNIYVIPNGYDEEDFMLKSQEIKSPDGTFIISYTGTLAESYNPKVFFHALKKVTEMFPGTVIKLRFVGNPSSSLIDYAASISLSRNLELIPAVSHDESVKYLLKSDSLLLVIPDVKNDKGILTGKLFEYLASRKPVICIGPPDGEAAFILNECKAGKTFARYMENELTQYISDLINSCIKGEDINIQNDFYKKYSRRSQASELSKIIKDPAKIV